MGYIFHFGPVAIVAATTATPATATVTPAPEYM